MEWIRVKDRLNIPFEAGEWNGKRTESVLVINKRGFIFEAVMYEGSIDGEKFKNFYTRQHELDIKGITHWMPSPKPPKN